jgi:hypothetical protein
MSDRFISMQKLHAILGVQRRRCEAGVVRCERELAEAEASRKAMMVAMDASAPDGSIIALQLRRIMLLDRRLVEARRACAYALLCLARADRRHKLMWARLRLEMDTMNRKADVDEITDWLGNAPFRDGSIDVEVIQAG